jgi:hypothetical protein
MMERIMFLRTWGRFTGILLCVLFCVSAAALGQSVTIDGLNIVRKDKGYAISGNIVADNLNPAGKTVVSDNVVVLAEIRLENDSEYPVLAETKSQHKPDWTQTPYRIANSFLTSKQVAGKGIQTFTIAKLNMREAPVWKVYGGADKWRTTAPSKVQARFESLIPLEYGNRPMRVRATLEQSYVAEKAGTEVSVLKHDSTQILTTLEMHAEAMKNLYPTPVENKTEKPAAVPAANADTEKPETTQPAPKPAKAVNPKIVFAKRMDLIVQVTTEEIDKPEVLKNLQKNFFQARDEYIESETAEAKSAYIALHRKLITTVMHTAIVKPESMSDVQLDYLKIAR